uniref:Insulin-like domain-containing protein n=1 Tax=Clastoptera arizonana TaxID=38151 RepID=A0A1B6D148_9HEMI
MDRTSNVKGYWGVMDFSSCFLALLAFIIHAQCQPYRYSTQKQACGDQLADIMSLVCSGRGYNVAFRPTEGLRRTRRGIVEECCRKSCTTAVLELYCSPEVPESPPNVPIRKRSDNDKTKSSEEDVHDFQPTISPSNKEKTTKSSKPINKLTTVNTEAPPNVYNKEPTQRVIQDKVNSIFPVKDDQKMNTKRIVQSLTEVEKEREKKLVETNNLGYILNHFLKDDARNQQKENTRRPPTVEPIRHWQSKKTILRHQQKHVPKKHSDEDTAFQLGVRMPYYSGRKQSRSRSHHLKFP